MKKHLLVFSPLIVTLSIPPLYIFIGKAKYMGAGWLLPFGKIYIFGVAPIYVIVSTLLIGYLFFSGKYVSRAESGIALLILCLLVVVLLVIAKGLSGLAIQGAGH